MSNEQISPFELALPGATIRGFHYPSVAKKARVLIVHGMAEHQLRYADLAGFLNRAGYDVYTYDHRGHGLTAGEPHSEAFAKNFGFVDETEGWKRFEDDLIAVTNYTRGNDGVPFFILAHSMGSLIARSSLVRPDFPAAEVKGVILSGTSGDPGPKSGLGILIAKTLISLFGPRHKSPLLNEMIFGTYNRLSVGGRGRTEFDWISHDETVVDAYILDEACGGVMTTSFYRDLLKGVRSLYDKSYKDRFPKDIAYLIFSGDEDPVGDFGRGVQSTYRDYKNWGVKDVSARLFVGGRHEMLNELNRQEVYALVISWLYMHVNGGSHGL